MVWVLNQKSGPRNRRSIRLQGEQYSFRLDYQAKLMMARWRSTPCGGIPGPGAGPSSSRSQPHPTLPLHLLTRERITRTRALKACHPSPAEILSSTHAESRRRRRSGGCCCGVGSSVDNPVVADHEGARHRRQHRIPAHRRGRRGRSSSSSRVKVWQLDGGVLQGGVGYGLASLLDGVERPPQPPGDLPRPQEQRDVS